MVSDTDLHFVVPGPLDQLTGGYVYDGHMVEGLRALGWAVSVHSLEGRFPDPDDLARVSMEAVLAALPDGARVVIDGLAMGGLPEPIAVHAGRLRIVSLVHHPLSLETGIPPADAARLFESERRALARSAGVIVSSAYTARGLGNFAVSAQRIRTVVPGTEPAPPAEGPGPGAPPALLCVASVTPRKGHEVLVEALAAVKDLEWTCVCVGGLDRDSAHADAVRRRVTDAALGDRITFVGERQGGDLDTFYRGASAFVLASFYEGYGMALADALAYGLPVVSTTGGAIPFTVPANAGLLVQPGNATAFAVALRTVLDPASSTRDELSVAARAYAATLPTWPAAARAFATAIEELTA